MAKPTKTRGTPKPYCFVSYSTGELHVEILIQCLEIVFGGYFDVKRTPSALESGTSQENRIEKLVDDCAFAVVSLDGLRPNVIYEYGLIRGKSKPMLLFKEKNANVDIAHFFRSPVELALQPPAIDMDKQFSNVKDLHHTEWSRYQIKETVKCIWDAFEGKKADINPKVDVPKPKLCI